MKIKAAIVDISNTLLSASHAVFPNTPIMIMELRKRNIEVFFISNNFYTGFALYGKRDIFGIQSDSYILDREKVGGAKGSKQFVQYVCDKINARPYELLYLGDERFDCFEAVNSGVAFFRAAWTNSRLNYGIPLESPLDFIKIIDTFFSKESLWYYTINDFDLSKRPVKVRALLNPDRATNTGIKDILKSKGERGPESIKSYPSSWYLSMHLFASIYLEGLHYIAGRTAIWCLYPGHNGPHKSVLKDFVSMTSSAFNEKNFSNLIIRHSEAVHSSASRYRGRPVDLNNQLQTIHLNADFKTLIKNKTVVVVDDFTTDAYSFETARNFIFNAEATSVICVAVGKYPKPYDARSPKEGIAWDSFTTSKLTLDDFNVKRVDSSIDSNALNYF